MSRPVLSMSGFGSASLDVAGARVLVEVKTVNSRGLDVSVSLPEALFALERDVKAAVSGVLTRGRVDLRVSVERESGPVASSGPLLDAALAVRYGKELIALAKKLRLAPPRVEALATLPGVTGRRAGAGETKKLGETVLRAVGPALTKLVAMRRKEGAALAADLRGRLASIESLTARIEAAWPAAAEAAREASLPRLKALLERLGEEKRAAAARDLLAAADRGDASEEIARLRSHLAQIREALAAGSPAGRKLDFLAQELHREASTTSAKSPSAAITALTVALREDVERIKEQVANVE